MLIKKHVLYCLVKSTMSYPITLPHVYQKNSTHVSDVVSIAFMSSDGRYINLKKKPLDVWSIRISLAGTDRLVHWFEIGFIKCLFAKYIEYLGGVHLVEVRKTGGSTFVYAGWINEVIHRIGLAIPNVKHLRIYLFDCNCLMSNNGCLVMADIIRTSFKQLDGFEWHGSFCGHSPITVGATDCILRALAKSVRGTVTISSKNFFKMATPRGVRMLCNAPGVKNLEIDCCSEEDMLSFVDGANTAAGEGIKTLTFSHRGLGWDEFDTQALVDLLGGTTVFSEICYEKCDGGRIAAGLLLQLWRAVYLGYNERVRLLVSPPRLTADEIFESESTATFLMKHNHSLKGFSGCLDELAAPTPLAALVYPRLNCAHHSNLHEDGLGIVPLDYWLEVLIRLVEEPSQYSTVTSTRDVTLPCIYHLVRDFSCFVTFAEEFRVSSARKRVLVYRACTNSDTAKRHKGTQVA